MHNNDDSNNNDDNASYSFGGKPAYAGDHVGRVRVIAHGDDSTARVQFRTNQGSIYEADPNAAGQVHIGGLYSGGLHGLDQGEDNYARVYVSAPSLGGGITARTADGSYPVTNVADLKPTDIVRLPNGYETTVEVARMNGLLSPGTLPGQQPQQQAQDQGENDQTQQQDQQQQASDPKESMGPEAESAMVEVLEKGGDTAFAALASLQQNGEVSRAVITEYATRLGVEPHVVEQKAAVILRGYSDDACRGASRVAGTDEALAYEALHDATKTRRSAFNEAMERHMETGRTGVYAPMVKDYIAGLGDTAPDRVLSAETGAGVQISRGLQGEIVVTTAEGSFRYEDAVRQGIVVVRSGAVPQGISVVRPGIRR